MKEIFVDIKYGKFEIYPSKEILDSIEGYVSDTYFRTVNGIDQFKVVLVNDNIKYVLNIIMTTVDFKILVPSLIKNQGKIKIELVKKGEYSNIQITSL